MSRRDKELLCQSPFFIVDPGSSDSLYAATQPTLCSAGFSVTILDSLVNSSPESVARVRLLVRAPEDAIDFVVGDVRSEAVLTQVLSKQRHDAIIHFAALKAVGESIDRPLDYYDNNLGGLTTVLVRVMVVCRLNRHLAGCHRFASQSC